MPFEVVVVASSLGGVGTLERVLSLIPADFPVPIVVVQHLSSACPSYLAEVLGYGTELRVVWAAQGERLRPRTVHLAPPDRHLRVGPHSACVLSDEHRVNWARPAADPLFESAAAYFGARALAVVLTGRLDDGAAGALAVRRAGGVVIAQDPVTCAAAGMPLAAIRRGAVDFVLPPVVIAHALVSLVTVPGAPALFGVARMNTRTAND